MAKFLSILALALVASVYAQNEPDDSVIVVPTNIPTELPTNIPTEVPTNIPTEVPTNIPTEVPTNIPTEVPTNIPTEIPTNIPTIATTPAPRGKTYEQIRKMCQDAHKNDKQADALIIENNCKATCASLERHSLFFFFNFNVIRKYDDPPTDLADGEICKEGSVCLAGKCVLKSTFNSCQNGSPVTGVTESFCSVTCSHEVGGQKDEKKENKNEGRICAFMRVCKNGDCKQLNGN